LNEEKCWEKIPKSNQITTGDQKKVISLQKNNDYNKLQIPNKITRYLRRITANDIYERKKLNYHLPWRDAFRARHEHQPQ
jgi:hypothetical protein